MHLASAQAKRMFEANPDEYAAAYEGWCATGLAATGRKVETDPSLFVRHEGVICVFSSTGAKDAFEKAPEETKRKADAAWADLEE